MIKRIFTVVLFSLTIGATFAQDFMMQGWYWDYPKTAAGASWADTLKNKATEMGQAGFTMLWLPPLCRTASGNWSNGYDPKDLYDYGEYNLGATGFGSRTQLNQLISAFSSAGINAVADLVYNHRDGGKAENNTGLANYIAGYNFDKANSGANPFPYDRMRVILPIGGSTGNVEGDYYFKLSSSSGHSKFYNYEYKVSFQTNRIGWQNLSNLTESEPNGGGDCSQSNNTIPLGQDMYATVDASGCKVDEFKLTLSANDFYAAGDTIFIYFGNRNSGYSDVRIYSIWCAPRSANIVSELKYQSYTNFSGLPSGQGAMNWSNFKPNNDRATSLEGDWDGMYFYYDYDQFQTDTKDKLYAWTRWNWNNVGIRGLRMDAVKHFTPEFIGDLLDNLYDNGISPPMVVGEWYGTNTDELSGWVNNVYSYMDNDTKLAIAPRIFDFALRDALRQACDQYGYDVRNVFGSSLVDQGKLAGLNVVTFANNHDFRDASGFASLIQNDRMLAYAYLLTNNQLGVPTVFYPDFFGYSSNDPGYYPSDRSAKKTQISQLMDIHKKYIFGSSSRTYLNKSGSGFANNASANNTLLVYQLKGGAGFKNLVVAINFSGSATSFNQQLDGIAVGTKLNELTGNSTTSVATVEASAGGISNSIYIQIPARSYAILRVGAWSLFTLGRSNISFNVKGTNTDFTVWNNASGTVQNADLGTFTGSDVLQISAYDIRSWKASGGDVTGGTFYYTVYPKGQRPGLPVFLSQSVTWQADIGGSGTTDQRWGFTGALNVLAGLSAGEYTIEFYTQMNGTDPIKSEYDNNGGAAANYTAHFRYNYVRSTAAGAWSNTSTWLNSVVPSGSGISAELDHAVELSDNQSVKDLMIQTGSLTINPAGSLTVNGTMTNSLSKTGLLLKSNQSNTASLIHSTSGIQATTERYISPRGINNHGWHFLSSPVNNFTLETSEFIVSPAVDYDFFAWSESEDLWLNQKVTANNITSFIPGKGYLVSYQTEDTKNISGVLNIADLPITGLTYTTASSSSGWHLIGNPFSSAINWTTGTWNKSSSIGGVPQLWDEFSASYKTLTDGIIPAHNGFMVYTASSGGSLTIPANARVHSSQSFYKSDAETSNQIILTAHDISGNTAQQTIIRFLPEATSGFDLDFDSYFLTGYAPMFYSTTNGYNLALNSLPSNQNDVSIPLAFVKNSSSQFNIQLTEFPQGSQVFLNDLKTNTVHSLSQTPIYEFTAADGDDPNRFELKFGTVGIDDPITQPSVNAWYAAGKLYLTNNTGAASVNIYNVQGQQIKRFFAADTGLQSLNLNLPTGVYFAQIISNGINHTVKIIVQ